MTLICSLTCRDQWIDLPRSAILLYAVIHNKNRNNFHLSQGHGNKSRRNCLPLAKSIACVMRVCTFTEYDELSKIDSLCCLNFMFPENQSVIDIAMVHTTVIIACISRNSLLIQSFLFQWCFRFCLIISAFLCFIWLYFTLGLKYH